VNTGILVIPGSRCQLPSEYFVIFALLGSNWPSIGRLELKNQVSLVSCRINFRYAKLILVYPRYASRSKLFSKYIIDKDIDNTAIDIIIYAGAFLYLLPVIILRQKQMLLTSMYVFCSNFLVTKCTRIGFPLNRDQSYLATNNLFYFQITKLINVYSIPATNN
jgi:hypothetical protein